MPSWAGVIGMTVTSSVLPAAFAPRGAWDRITWDASNSRLFVSTGEDGLVMVPVAGGVPLVANASLLPSSADCNGVVITPGAGGIELGFAGDVAEFTANTGDNGMGINVYSLGPSPVPFAANSVVDTGGVGVDNGVYDAFSSSVIMTLVNGSVLSLSASTGARKAVVNVYLPGCANNGAPCDPLEYPVVDGKGNLYINGAEANKVFHLSTKPLSLIGAYDVAPFNCIDPTGLDIDATRNRLFVGCANPVRFALPSLHDAMSASSATVSAVSFLLSFPCFTPGQPHTAGAERGDRRPRRHPPHRPRQRRRALRRRPPADLRLLRRGRQRGHHPAERGGRPRLVRRARGRLHPPRRAHAHLRPRDGHHLHDGAQRHVRPVAARRPGRVWRRLLPKRVGAQLAGRHLHLAARRVGVKREKNEYRSACSEFLFANTMALASVLSPFRRYERSTACRHQA